MDFLKHFQKEIAKRGLTENTIKSYSTYISRYLDYVKYTLRKYPSQVTYNDQRKFLDVIQKERNLSDRTMNCVIAQLRFFTMYVLHKPWDPTQLPVRKFDTYLPFVPTQNEVKTFISTMTDIKQKAMVVVMYSAGLRISEVCHLRYEDISRTNMRIHIRHGKNRSDRYAILSKYALDVLTVYWLKCGRPMGWLFPKQRDSSEPIDTYFLLRHIEEHEKELGWPKRLTCHSFRHAFGTHLYENGTDLETIRVLMGHKSLSSTIIYVHLAVNGRGSMRSPLDRMMEETR
jgi:integrase/recombinase XerD